MKETHIAPQLARITTVFVGVILFAFTAATASAQQTSTQYLYDDEHVHITNYIQEGTDIHAFLKLMGDKVGRAALFGIPLQQQWSYANSGNYAPTYYLQTDAPLYYYSFTDAVIAMMYKSLTKEEQARFDPMITGFDPADMYAADHIRRVLQTFPGVFEGIGEFTIHKEFVSSKVSGETASLLNLALTGCLISRVTWACWLSSTTTWMCHSPNRILRGIFGADARGAGAASQDHNHMGAHGHGACRATRAGTRCHPREYPRGSSIQQRLFRYFLGRSGQVHCRHA